MQWTYDPVVDALSIQFCADRRSARTEEVRPGVILDSDVDGRLIAIEFTNASVQFSEDVLRSLPSPGAVVAPYGT